MRSSEPMQMRGDRSPELGAGGRALSAVGAGALALLGIRRGGFAGAMLAGGAGVLLKRALTGRPPLAPQLGSRAAEPVVLTAAVTVGVSRRRAYDEWRRFARHPQFFRPIESVEPLDERRTRWTVAAPAGLRREWISTLTEDVPGERIEWRSAPGSQVEQAGEVEFRPAPANRGTAIHLRWRFEPPAGPLGVAVAELLGPLPDKLLRDGLRRFKQLVETGEIATVDGQPSGRRPS